ncbi:MAG: TetR family transcriptional regulator [Microbacterium sp.]|uniref:TetR/AcrR family transcriptional regulator n=1 Tax=Microbacterium aquimaris TaxID=459816 RepID=UPI000C8E5CC5|nr:TetR/AcrR family transcriptional regulator [Microbacterium aquimaris]MAP62810.1 TetR family transcriptional regulator [Microbacterium sp.]MDZ8275776.1 TetR/AcrR family transcriptional regulator [Microbacterium aquimaris]|tara:strand:+ start:99 stop:647 length:549 start_codon:yes stop_codon:yes gene_type:complete
MSRPPLAREKVLDAYEAILITDGERAATMDAIARDAGVSKGGLLYHYESKEALETALIGRMTDLALVDIDELAAAPDGPVAAFVRTSVMTGHPLDRAITATSKLAQAGNTAASDALRGIRDRWADMVRPHVRDETALQLVLLVSDGLYFNNALVTGVLPGPLPRGADLDALVELVVQATRDA